LARNDVNVGVTNGLARSLAFIHADVEPIWFILLLQQPAHLADQRPDFHQLPFRQVKEQLDVPLWNGEGVTVRDGESIKDRDSRVGFEPDTLFE
jgi:hypothetical protein